MAELKSNEFVKRSMEQLMGKVKDYGKMCISNDASLQQFLTSVSSDFYNQINYYNETLILKDEVRKNETKNQGA